MWQAPLIWGAKCYCFLYLKTSLFLPQDPDLRIPLPGNSSPWKQNLLISKAELESLVVKGKTDGLGTNLPTG